MIPAIDTLVEHGLLPAPSDLRGRTLVQLIMHGRNTKQKHESLIELK